MKIKNNKFPIIFLLVFLTSITITSSNLFIYSSDKIIDSQANIENDSSNLKLSLIEDWNVTWDKGDNEYGQSVAIYETTGDIYVVGYNGSVDYDVILIKYNPNGKQQWNITWDGGVYEYGYDVAVDSLGYIYVAAANGTSYPNFDVLLLKFNSNGDLEWKSSYDSGLYDGAWALTIDSQNMIYVVGQTFTTSTDTASWFFELTGLDNGRIGNRNYNSAGESNFFDGIMRAVAIIKPDTASEAINILYKELAGLYFVYISL